MYSVKIDTASSGDTALVAAVAGRRIRVHQYVMVGGGTVNVKFRSNTTDVTGAMPLSSGSGVSASCVPTEAELDAALFYTAVGEALNINLSTGQQVSGHLSYSLDTV